MVCRQFGLSSAVIGQVRTTSWLDDAQIQSVYHTALHDPLLFGGDSANWSREQLIETVTGWARRDATFNPVYRPQRREGLRRRIEEGYAPAVAEMPTERLSALARLRTAVTAAEAATRARLQLIAGERGMSEREVTREFHQLRSEAPTGRQARATDEQREDLRLIPLDPATRYAITELQARPPMRTPIPRVDHWVPVQRGTAGGSNPIVEVGFSDSDDRVELRRADGTIDVRVYSGLHTQTHQFTQAQAAAYLAWPEPVGADRQPWRLRCDDCGRFVPRSGHRCLAGDRMAAATTVVVDENTQLRMPRPADLLNAGRETGGLVRAEVEVAGNQGGVVTGAIRIHADGAAITADAEPYPLDIDDNGDDLTCQECGSIACEHVQQARLLVRRELRRARRTPASATVDAALPNPSTWSVTDRPTEPAPAPAPETTFNFRDSPQAFREAARSGHNDGVTMLPAGSFDAGYTRGITFGVELEYSGGSAAAGVGAALHRAGVIDSARMQRYHGGARMDVRQQRWRFESDTTVTGELITPVFADTAEAWEQISSACTALRENGAATHGAGSHTNIGGIAWGPGDLWRLAHLVRAHEDDLMRLGRTRGSHRDWVNWAAPVRPISEDAWTLPREASVGRGMLNFAHAFMPEATRRVEFRFPDASLDAGVIQAQTRLCAAMTGYAVASRAIPVGQHTATGSAWSRGRHMTMRLSAGEFADQTEPIRGLIDDLFTTDAERLQIAQLWGHGAYRR